MLISVMKPGQGLVLSSWLALEEWSQADPVLDRSNRRSPDQYGWEPASGLAPASLCRGQAAKLARMRGQMGDGHVAGPGWTLGCHLRFPCLSEHAYLVMMRLCPQ